MIPSLQIPRVESKEKTIVKDEDKSEFTQKTEKLRVYSKICSKIDKQLFIAGETVASDLKILQESQITHIINCARTYCDNYFPDDFNYLALHLNDGRNEDISCFFLHVIEFIENTLAESENNRILFHCQQGVSRSVAFYIMYEMWLKRESFDSVFIRVKKIRAIANPNTGFIFQLLLWGKRLGLTQAPSLPWAMLISPHSNFDPNTFVSRNVDIKYTSLDCRGIFLIETNDVIYKWIGSNAFPALEKPSNDYIVRLQRFMNASEHVIIIQQGSEPEEFCELLGGSPANAEERKQFDAFFAPLLDENKET